MIDFRSFFGLVHPGEPGGRDRVPYPWQEQMAMRLLEGRPPPVIAIPTGGGKTATIDALIWALAMQADRPAASRTVGVRIVWAIDRRILVDEVYEHVSALAERLATALADPVHPLFEIAEALQRLTGEPGLPPLLASRWRGGLRVDARASHPFQAEVITSTVAQIGSRLLFRGYGVGERSLAIEAALAAVDTTICLDEAHLAEPFRQTVDMIRAVRDGETTPLPPLNVIKLTATPVGRGANGEEALSVTAADVEELGARVTGPKHVRLVEPDAGGDGAQEAALLGAIGVHLEDGATTVACVVNSVRMALLLRSSVRKRFPEVDEVLLIGPQRPVDRERLLAEHRAVLFDRQAPSRPLVCIATQTFEVGLDADVEALVTQSASTSALIQRLGRLNRAGTRVGRATIVRDEGAPLYAAEEPAAWAWLNTLVEDGVLDGSVLALSRASARPSESGRASAPALTDHVLELLVQTSPRPASMADPDIEAFLRGADAEPSADVAVAWRCDLRLEEDRDARIYREALLKLVPPQPHELVTLGIGRARALLASRRGAGNDVKHRSLSRLVVDDDDVEGGSPEPPTPAEGGWHGQRFVVLRGGDYFEVVTGDRGPADLRLRDIRPGDVIVLPSEAGGYEDGALAPTSSKSVDDSGPDLVARPKAHAADPSWHGSAAVAVRLSHEALSQVVKRADGTPDTAKIGRLLALAGAVDARPGRAEPLRLLADSLLAHYGAEVTDRLAARDEDELVLRRLTPDPDPLLGDLDEDDPDPAGRIAGLDLGGELEAEPGTTAVLFADERPGPGPAFVLVVRRAARDNELRGRDGPPTLAQHVRDVTDRAASFAARARLSDSINGSLELAARAHDHGKGDPRIQAYYRRGAPSFEEPIAKSVFGTADRRADRSARRAADLPTGLRHEIDSVAILAEALSRSEVVDLPVAYDGDLALHLVATHHGLGRPIPQVPEGGRPPGPFAVSVEGITGVGSGDGRSGWAEGEWLRRFGRIIERYGPWGTAYLEALLMLADRSVSREGR